MRVAIALLTRDLRVHDNPALVEACAAADRVVPLFVADPRLAVPGVRRRFLVESLADLRDSLRARGGDLVVRSGDPATEVARLAREVSATVVTVAADASRYAGIRRRALEEACRAQRLDLRVAAGPWVVGPGEVRPSGGGDHYRVFSPYWRAWSGRPFRPPVPPPRRVPLPPGVVGIDPAMIFGSVPARPAAFSGGEHAGRRQLAVWARRSVRPPGRSPDELALRSTSGLSPYLHFGCVSAAEVAAHTAGLPDFLRQLCWRDFYLQVLAVVPDLAQEPYRPGAPDKWHADPVALAAWQAGRTGVPIVDAGMRQLAVEGWLPNRARLITAAYLTKDLGLDWREGLRWYERTLVDADLANNAGNWQWVAGTGHDTRPYRRFNAIRQAYRFDPDGTYVRRWIPELAHVEGGAVHEPWRLPRPPRGYPPRR